ncbi:MAG: dipeptidase [Steroidobacteraceae bacterium]
MTVESRVGLNASHAAPAIDILPGDPIASLTVINALGALEDPNQNGEHGLPAISSRVLTDARASGMTAVNITLGYIAGPAEPFQSTVASVARWDRAIREHSQELMKVLTAADIPRAKSEGKVGLVYGFQNGAMMGEDAARVEIFANLGVRVIQLTYNGGNSLGDGCMTGQDRPLSSFGHEVVAQLNANRVMVDLSHSGRRTCLDGARASRQPVSINHTGCRALADFPRNKTDEELRLVAENGGFVGIYFMMFLSASGQASATDVVAHIEHALNVCGEDHVGIGTDGGTTPVDDLKGYEVQLAKIHADRVAQGIAAAGEGADTFPFVKELRGPEQFRRLARLLATRGHKAERIEKILGTNFLRYAREVWGA